MVFGTVIALANVQALDSRPVLRREKVAGGGVGLSSGLLTFMNINRSTFRQQTLWTEKLGFSTEPLCQANAVTTGACATMAEENWS